MMMMKKKLLVISMRIPTIFILTLKFLMKKIMKTMMKLITKMMKRVKTSSHVSIGFPLT